MRKSVEFREITGGKHRTRLWRKLAPPILICLLAVGFYGAAERFGLFTILDLGAFDYFLMLRNHFSPPTVPDNIVIVAIDEASMSELGLQWPWPRSLHADLVTTLVEARAAVIVFDVLFLDPAKTEDDLVFAAAIKNAGNVVLGEDIVIDADATYRPGTYTHRRIWERPLDILLDSAKRTAIATVVRDPDNFVRRAFLQTDGIPSLAQGAAEVYLETRGKPVETSDTVSAFGLPHNLDQPLLINFLGPPHSYKTVSYFEALEPQKYISDGLFDGAIVLVGRAMMGTPDLGSADYFAYPFMAPHHPISGVEIHASLIDTLLRRRYLSQVEPPIERLLFLLLLASGAASLMATRKWYGAVLFWGFAILYAIASFGAFYYRGHVLNFVTPLACYTGFFLIERAYKIIVVDREKRFIHKAFKHYVPPAVVDQLCESPERLNLYGERFDVTVVFTDLAGFTSMAEKMEPMQVRRFITGYFTEMVDIFMANNGTLDKFIGDAIMCFFGAPMRTPEHAYQGSLTASQMSARLADLNREWEAQGLPPLFMRIGVSSGPVVAGNIGTKDLFNYTVMGDIVNLGSRLEGANKVYGTSIIMGEATYALAGGRFDTRKLDSIRVKGKKKSLFIYELLGPRGTVPAEKDRVIKAYEAAFEAYQLLDFAESLRLLEGILGRTQDRPSEVLLKRCREYLVTPPCAGWDGVYEMTTK